MKASELRIGNWVEYKNHYVQWDNSDFVDGTACRISKPIPLTEQWLERFGFEKESNEYFIIDHPQCSFLLFYSAIHNKYWNFCHVERRQYHSTKAIDYVHQLQNLYFALTGQELELKEETRNTIDQK